jgi:succinate-semialdehyde dehydrogenase/glutarate-semialdehyde dehydrogenase
MTLKSINPHDQSVVGELPVSTPKEVEAAYQQARAAFNDWKNSPITNRISYIIKFRQLLVDHADELAELTTKEMGKPLSQSKDDVTGELSFLDYYINQSPNSLSPEIVLKDNDGEYIVTYQPHGVVACISPWNFPLSMATSGIIPALIAGNTVIFKPSEYTSLSQKLIADLINQSGLPAGALNTVIGGGEVGELLTDQPIDLVWFTGSTKVGQSIYQKCGKKFIRALLEMGGSSPAIVFADADIDNAIDQLYWARFLNAGQVCTAIKRLFVERSVYDEVVNKLKGKLQSIKVGNPLENSDIGPLVTKRQLETLIAQVDDAVGKGAKVEFGGQIPTQLTQGNYYLPTILTNVTMDMRVMTEEVFGPVLPIVPFDTADEAVTLANQTDYGLSAEIYTKDLDKAHQLAAQIEAGTVAINTDNFFKPECPFGGFKKSGMGKEYGEIGIREFTRQKLIAIRK